MDEMTKDVTRLFLDLTKSFSFEGSDGNCGNVDLNLSAIQEKWALKCCAISFSSSLTASPILILLISRLFFPEPVSVLILFQIPLELPLFSSKALQKNFPFKLLIITTTLFLAAL